MKIRCVALMLLACTACYSNNAAVKAKLLPRGDEARPLYVGTSINGDIVVAATHYDAMSGLAVAADDVGQMTKDGMTCSREMVTGTHVPAWFCRYDKDALQERMATQNYLSRPRNCMSNCGGPSNPHTH